jgi:hypothetical protein
MTITNGIANDDWSDLIGETSERIIDRSLDVAVSTLTLDAA